MINLAHVNIRTSDLDGSVAFYRDVIGLERGPAATRPGSRDHVWMSDEQGSPCIHLQRTAAPPATDEERGGIHHVAFACTKPQDWRDKLDSMGIDYREAAFAEARMIQFNLSDPNGVRLELLFEAE
jgi:catechol 2,3-dioxygenase-like lactoylglutathione lyase family enzyme